MKRIAIIGGGPAGLMAAEAAAGDDTEVHLYDAKPSVGRKFLVAGKSGLNITNSEDWETFKTRYSAPSFAPERFNQILDSFDSQQLRSWVRDLGLETFAVRSGKVFPRPMKAAPLLRAWIARLKASDVAFHMGHRLCALEPSKTVEFETNNGIVKESFDAIVLALGGASWSRTGSDGRWAESFSSILETAAWESANCGWNADLPDDVRQLIEGEPLKNLRVSVGQNSETGELMPTRYGFEGTPLYALGPHLRKSEQAILTIDFKPMFSQRQLETKMESVKHDFSAHAKQRWKLSAAATALLDHFHGPFESAASLAQACKACKIPLKSPRPIEEAISTAGGLLGTSLNEQLMVRHFPGLYACGEMLDWEAPTGGYLLQACLATGRFAGISAKKG